MSFIFAVLLLGILIVVHEAGHFVVAKLSGVYVERFSVGFGPVILKKKIGETEYCLSLLPLGGYVKMLGEEPDEEIDESMIHRSFSAKRPLVKSLIVLAGPLSNLIFPVFIFLFIYTLPYSTTPPVVGTVMPESPAERAGIKVGDKIISVDGHRVFEWSHMSKLISERAQKKTKVVVERNNKLVELSTIPEKRETIDRLGDRISAGRLGISSARFAAVIGVKKNSLAHKMGLRNFDRVLEIGGKSVVDYNDLLEKLKRFCKNGCSITIQRSLGIIRWLNEIDPEIVLEKRLPTFPDGIFPASQLVYRVLKDSPAMRAGILEGDRILSVNGRPFVALFQLSEELSLGEGKEVELEIERGTKRVKFKITPERIDFRGAFGSKRHTFYIGVVSDPDTIIPGEMVSLGFSVPRGIVMTYFKYNETMSMILKGFYKLLTGQVGLNNLGGPIMILDVASKAARSGIIQYLFIMVFISLNLGLLNLLPIPILDGGHLVFFSIEALIKRELPEIVQVIANYIGLGLLILLMLVAFRNDILRYWGNIKSLF